jgi:ribosomal RNA-processing protein 12
MLHKLLNLLQDTTKAYRKVAELLEKNLGQSTGTRNSDSSDGGSITTIMQDILLLLIPYLTSADAATLFQLSFTPHVLGNSDNGVQKRGYRTLARLIDSGKVTINAESTIQKLNEVSYVLSASAKKVRRPLSHYEFLHSCYTRTDLSF